MQRVKRVSTHGAPNWAALKRLVALILFWISSTPDFLLYVQNPTGCIVPEVYRGFITKFITFITRFYHESYHALARARTIAFGRGAAAVCGVGGGGLLLCGRVPGGRAMLTGQPLSSRGHTSRTVLYGVVPNVHVYRRANNWHRMCRPRPGRQHTQLWSTLADPPCTSKNKRHGRRPPLLHMHTHANPYITAAHRGRRMQYDAKCKSIEHFCDRANHTARLQGRHCFRRQEARGDRHWGERDSGHAEHRRPRERALVLIAPHRALLRLRL